MTDQFKRYRQTEKEKRKKCRYVMLRPELESHPTIIGACAHNKDDNKQSEEFGVTSNI